MQRQKYIKEIQSVIIEKNSQKLKIDLLVLNKINNCGNRGKKKEKNPDTTIEQVKI